MCSCIPCYIWMSNLHFTFESVFLILMQTARENGHSPKKNGAFLFWSLCQFQISDVLHSKATHFLVVSGCGQFWYTLFGWRECVVVCYSVLRCLAVSRSVVQCLAVLAAWRLGVTMCNVLQRIVGCCSVLQCVAVCCSVLQCVAACCSVLQCVAVCCSVLHRWKLTYHYMKWLRPSTPAAWLQRNCSATATQLQRNSHYSLSLSQKLLKQDFFWGGTKLHIPLYEMTTTKHRCSMAATQLSLVIVMTMYLNSLSL